MHNEKLEKLPMAHNVHTITSPVLIPLSESQEGGNLILSESALSQRLRFRAGIVRSGSCFSSLHIHESIFPPLFAVTLQNHLAVVFIYIVIDYNKIVKFLQSEKAFLGSSLYRLSGAFRYIAPENRNR